MLGTLTADTSRRKSQCCVAKQSRGNMGKRCFLRRCFRPGLSSQSESFIKTTLSCIHGNSAHKTVPFMLGLMPGEFYRVCHTYLLCWELQHLWWNARASRNAQSLSEEYWAVLLSETLHIRVLPSYHHWSLLQMFRLAAEPNQGYNKMQNQEKMNNHQQSKTSWHLQGRELSSLSTFKMAAAVSVSENSVSKLSKH